MSLKKKLATIMLFFALLNTAVISTTYAQDTLTEGAGAAAETEGDSVDTDASGNTNQSTFNSGALSNFDVGEYLKVGDQEHSYLQDDRPIISFILTIIDFLAKVIGTVAVLLIFIGGALLMASEGDDNRIQKGKAIIFQAIVGLILAITSYLLVSFVQSLLYVQNI